MCRLLNATTKHTNMNMSGQNSKSPQCSASEESGHRPPESLGGDPTEPIHQEQKRKSTFAPADCKDSGKSEDHKDTGKSEDHNRKLTSTPEYHRDPRKSKDWIGMHLFNNNTHPSGRHISLPSQVGFSHSYLCSINEFHWWCSVVGINSIWECRQLVIDLNKEL